MSDVVSSLVLWPVLPKDSPFTQSTLNASLFFFSSASHLHSILSIELR